ncbi:MAG: ExbD/TolR family protein [Limnohabitans sp.]
MAMNVGNLDASGSEPEVMIEMNATPLIDVMMVLLIMLIITIPVQLHSVNLDMPVASKNPPKTDPVIVRVEVDAANGVRWNGTPLSDAAELEARLQQAAAQQPQPEIHIRSHARARYATVAGVLAGAQRSGLKKLGIVGSEQYAF